LVTTTCVREFDWLVQRVYEVLIGYYHMWMRVWLVSTTCVWEFDWLLQHVYESLIG